MADKEIVIHGTFLNIFSVGTLITGEPGIGKSELALGLIDRQHQLIADDAPIFKHQDSCIVGTNPLDRHFLSVRGIGLIDVELMFGPSRIKQSQELRLLIHLEQSPAKHALSHLQGEHFTKDVLRCLIPCVTIPIINPRNLELLVETIVKNYLLKVNKEIFPMMNFEELIQQKMESTPS